LVEEALTFEDGIALCKHVFQCAVHKTLNGVPEEWAIFTKTHHVLSELGCDTDMERLEGVLFKLNLDNIYKKV
jgi:hypothetical protein